MAFELALWLIPAFFAGALLYATVGHGGASAWLRRLLAVVAIAGGKLAFV